MGNLNNIIMENNHNIIKKKELYYHIGIISKIIQRDFYPTKIYFKEWFGCFCLSQRKTLPKNVQVDSYIKIKFKEVIVDTYSIFWIKKIKIIKETPLSIICLPPKIRCTNCKELCTLTDFQRCKGMSRQFNEESKCDLCNSLSSDKNVGKRCFRQSMKCKSCDFVREI